MDDERYAFLVEWYDPTASLIRQYQFLFYVKDNSIEMYDVKNRRPFLKRTKCDTVKVSDLYVGANMNVFSRQLNFVDFGDEFTRKTLSAHTEKTLAIVKPSAVDKLGVILECIAQNNLSITNLKMVQLTRAEALEFYKEHEHKSFVGQLLTMMTSGPCVVMELMGPGAIQAWRNIMGPTDPGKARQEAVQSLRARFGSDVTNNAVHGSDSLESARREVHFFFGADRMSAVGRNTAQAQNSTLALIKPHAVLAGTAGRIINYIQEKGGFRVTCSRMFHLDRVNAEEFLEVYKGVVAEYPGMVTELVSGPLLALEVTLPQAGSSVEVQQAFRQFVGPIDPEVARHLRPNTLRAVFGKDKIRNAVHCTDLPEDTELEVQYFFQILSK